MSDSSFCTGDKESAWSEAGLSPGIQIWRIEKFAVVQWPTERVGSFYDGDSYIVLHVGDMLSRSTNILMGILLDLQKNT